LRFPQLRGEPDDGTLRGHARGVGCWFVEQFRHFLVGVSQLNPGHDQLAILQPQTRKRPLVARDCLLPDGFFQWRSIAAFRL
jgi:hypothetical protein